MYSVTKSFEIEIAHYLTKVPPGHKCARHHGHRYEVSITVESPELDEMGMVADYAVISAIREKLDHQTLNDVVDFETTAENMARYICEELQGRLPSICTVTQVDLHETSSTVATWRPL